MKTLKNENQASWKTVSANLVRFVSSGTYYARVRVNGKLHRKSLKTNRVTVARLRLSDFAKELHERASSSTALVQGKMKFKDACEIFQRKLNERTDIKESTKHYYRENITALLKSWTGLAETDVAKITENACQEWAARYKRAVSAVRFNNTASLLRQILNIAIKAGVRYGNPAADIKRARVKQTELKLPTRNEFIQFVHQIDTARGRFSKDCADYVRFLAFSGCRKGEAAAVKWSDVDFTRGEIVIRGDAITGTKNHEIRRVHMIPEIRSLLERLKTERPHAKPTDCVLLVNEAQKAMDRAARLVGIERITHHDLRHLFATTLIEQGIDIPTVARLLGHKDGGALAMKTYGHLREDHAKASVGRVRFDESFNEEKIVPFSVASA